MSRSPSEWCWWWYPNRLYDPFRGYKVRAVDSDLPGKAWEMLEALLTTGKLVLGNGEEREASVKEILSATQFVASRQVLRPKSMPENLDHLIRRTDE
jgi:hypothetical protein